MNQVRNSIRELRPFVIILLCLGLVWLVTRQINADNGRIRVSGTLEAVEIPLAAEIGGRVIQVNVTEGQLVQAGDVLVRFEDEELRTQFERAQVNLEQAQFDFQLVNTQPLVEQHQFEVAAAELDLLLAQQNLQNVLDNAELAQAKTLQDLENATDSLDDLLVSEVRTQQAWAAVRVAEKNVYEARRNWLFLTTPASRTAIDQFYANLLLAESSLATTRADIAEIQQKLQGGANPYWPFVADSDFKKQLRKSLQYLALNMAHEQKSYENAQQRYKDLLAPPEPIDLALAEAALAKAEAQLAQAQRYYERLKNGPTAAEIAVSKARVDAAQQEAAAHQNGPDLTELAIAQAQVEQAEANLRLARTNIISAQLAVAQSQLELAEATFAVVQAQIDRLSLTAPLDGTVLQRKIEPGEIISPGDPVLSLGLLADLTFIVLSPCW